MSLTLAVILTFNLALSTALISPGPALILCIQTTLRDGRSAGILTALGLAIGAASWAAFAMFGLTAIFKIIPSLYLTLKLIACVYLIYLAIKIWKSADNPMPTPRHNTLKPVRIFIRAILVNLTNPKCSLFFASILLAILPKHILLADNVFILCNVLLIEASWYSIIVICFAKTDIRAAYFKLKPKIDRASALFLGSFGIAIGLTR